ncbi:MAG: DUF4358 domain-containing protein [Clostridia bacterium]|nr:DUF4358 domain-containing protein [Clostridia bacterium]
MIKKIAVILSVAMIMGSVLCACGDKEENTSQVNSAVSQNVVQEKTLTDVFSDIKTQVNVSEMVEFQDVSSLDRYYGITAEQVLEFAGGINNSGVEQEEIVLLKASSDADVEALKTALENRRQSKLNENKNYNPEQAEIIEKCSVETNGLYVFMIISPNNEQMTQIFKTDLNLS